MTESKQTIEINPLLITFIVIALLYITLATFFPFDSFTTLVIFVLISLISTSLANIIFSLMPGFMSVSERFINVLHSFIVLILTGVSVTLSMQKPMFSMEVIMNFLILSFFIIGGICIVLGFINTGYPKWFRLSIFLLGLFSMLLSPIAIMFPQLGYFLLTLIITPLMIIMKSLNINS